MVPTRHIVINKQMKMALANCHNELKLAYPQASSRELEFKLVKIFSVCSYSYTMEREYYTMRVTYRHSELFSCYYNMVVCRRTFSFNYLKLKVYIAFQYNIVFSSFVPTLYILHNTTKCPSLNSSTAYFPCKLIINSYPFHSVPDVKPTKL